MAKRIQVGGRIESKEVGGIVTGAAEILDDAKGKKQSVINQETDDELVRLDQSKQDNLTFDNAPTEGSDNPVKSGGVYAADKALSDAIEAILLLIPSAASALNKLVDTATMNSSISMATATFRGTYNVVTDLSLTIDATHEQIAAKLAQVVSEADNNDYAFVQVTVSAESTDIRRTERYKFNGTVWGYEYDLNTSGFTAAQWAALNSGITIALVGKLIGLPTSAELQALLGQKQDTLTFDNIPVSGSANPVKSGGVYSAINDEKTAREQLANTVTGIDGRVEGVEEVIPTGAAVNNKLVANNSMEAYVTSIIEAITASFTIATADGHINITLTQTNGRVASLTLTSSDIASAQALTALTGRVSTAESDITTLGGRVSTNETDIANLQQLYNDLQQSKPEPVTALPDTGQQQGVIYRLAGTTSYSDYMWNGSTWVLMATYNNAIDPRPKKASQNLVTSGGVFDNMGALDVSELNATENPHTLAQYTDLSAALAAIPTDYQKGGMSIKFVQSSDNKYVQYLCNSQIFTTDETGWKKVATQKEIDKLRLDGYTFCGFALKTATPATLYGNGYYIALQKGVYPNFGNLEVTENNTLLNLLCWDSYQNRWWLNKGITIANVVEDGNPFVVTSQAVYDKINSEVNPLKKNKYLSVDNGVYNKLTELYLSGVDKTHSYRLDYFGYNNGVQWAFIYDVNTNTRVAYIVDDTLSKGIIPLTTDNNSGVSGYIMMNVQATTTDERVSGSILNLDVVTNKANSPCIAAMNPFVASNWKGIGDSIKELYLYGLNPIGEYTIKYCGYDPVNNRDCLFIYNSNNTLVAYMLDATRSKGIVPIVSNDSIISGYIIKDFKETATDQRQEAKLNVANASNRALSPIIDKEESVVIAADGTGDYTSLTEGIKHAVGMRYANVIVKGGTYDIIAEHKALYGDDFFTNYTAAAEANSYKRGIFLKNNINILFSKGAKVLCDNTDGNDASKKDFAPFNSGEYGFTINGLNLYAKCTRYCVHDERNSEEDSYKNHYINCYMELDNSQNDPWSFRGCIGGGLGCYGNIIVENCQFKSAGADNRAIVSWHNTAAAKGKSLVVIKDCYFYGLSSVYIHYYGTSTDISTMMVSNCSFGIAPLPVAPEGTATVENVELIAWNNEVRQ